MRQTYAPWGTLLDFLRASPRLLLHVASEIAPFSKKGGLGDMLESFTEALASVGLASLVCTPYYAQLGGSDAPQLACRDQVAFKGISYTYCLYVLVRQNIGYLFVRLEEAFSFEALSLQGSLPYRTEVEELSYFLFGKILADFLTRSVPAALVITHDWHVAALYPYLRQSSARVMTFHVIHNYHYQGELFPDSAAYLEDVLAQGMKAVYEKYGSCSMSALALEYTDHIITVSPSYAQELRLQTAPHPGMRVLRDRNIIGLMNGIHPGWNPAHDTLLVAPYTRSSVEQKAQNKRHLLRKLGLADTPEIPVVLLMSRLTIQKGIELLLDLKNGPAFDPFQRMQNLLDLPLTFIVCGLPQGGPGELVDRQFQALHARFPQRFCYLNRYNEELAHQLLAGADLLLHPSRFEPCGLTPMHALRYGTLPVVTRAGGLKDSVVCALQQPEEGFGFAMQQFGYAELFRVLQQAVMCYQERDRWKQLMCRAMQQRNGWEVRIQPYKELFEGALNELHAPKHA